MLLMTILILQWVGCDTLLYDEVDVLDQKNRFEHRLILWPKREVAIQFAALALTQVSVQAARHHDLRMPWPNLRKGWESPMCRLCMRGFIRGAGALGTAGVVGLSSSSLMAQAERGDGGSGLPARAEFTISNAY